MGSPRRGIFAFIYLKFIESGHFKYKIPIYFRYIDDILLIYTQELNLIKITDRLNKIEPTVKFIYELETNSSLLF